MAIPALDETAKERSTFPITITFRDEDAALVVPASATWTLTDLDGNVINGRSEVVITPLGTSVTIVLTGDDLAVPNPAARERELLVQALYDSSLGSGLTLNDAVRFTIDNLLGL